MKFFKIFPLLLALSGSLQAGRYVSTDTLIPEKTLLERLTGNSKHSKLLNIDLNTRIAFHSVFSGKETDRSAFRLDYIRLEVKGDITDRIFYKWLQHLNRSNRSGRLDNMPSSIDCLGVGFHITPALSTFIGKQYADFGGFEYDANPAEIYEYSDMGEYMTCFLVGANLAWWVTPSQELRFQVVDSRSASAEETYGTLPENFEVSKAPLGYTLNWNGNFFGERLLTRCSFSLFHEGKRENVYFWALAAAWVQKNFNMYFDFMYSAEDIDKLGILSEFLQTEDRPARIQDGGYLSLVSRINCRIYPKLNLFVKGMYETASIRKSQGDFEKGKYRTSWGYQGGIEYFPMEENLHFFLMYRGRQFDYTSKARLFGTVNEHPQQLSLGVIYKIPVY